jgi:hypothetical protein
MSRGRIAPKKAPWHSDKLPIVYPISKSEVGGCGEENEKGQDSQCKMYKREIKYKRG